MTVFNAPTAYKTGFLKNLSVIQGEKQNAATAQGNNVFLTNSMGAVIDDNDASPGKYFVISYNICYL